MSYFVRQKTASVQDSEFKLVKLYAYADNEEPHLREPEHNVLNIEGKKKFSDSRCRELFEVIVESNFNAGDFAMSFALSEKEVLNYLAKMKWVYLDTPTYVCCSGRDNNGELRFTVLLRSDGKLTEDRLMSLCRSDARERLNIQRLERDENGLLILPSVSEAPQYCEWCCSDNIQSPTVTVEDDVIKFEDLEALLKAKIGEDTTPIMNRMFGEWEVAHSRFTSFEYDEAGNPHIEFRLVKQGNSITKGKSTVFERD